MQTLSNKKMSPLDFSIHTKDSIVMMRDDTEFTVEGTDSSFDQAEGNGPLQEVTSAASTNTTNSRSIHDMINHERTTRNLKRLSCST